MAIHKAGGQGRPTRASDVQRSEDDEASVLDTHTTMKGKGSILKVCCILK